MADGNGGADAAVVAIFVIFVMIVAGFIFGGQFWQRQRDQEVDVNISARAAGAAEVMLNEEDAEQCRRGGSGVGVPEQVVAVYSARRQWGLGRSQRRGDGLPGGLVAVANVSNSATRRWDAVEVRRGQRPAHLPAGDATSCLRCSG